MIGITDTESGWAVDFTEEDDPQGWLRLARSVHLGSVLAALGDPMVFAEVKADGDDAAAQLRAVSWFLERLTHRQGALIVALKERGTSWTELARLVDPEEDDPKRLRSAMQRRYDTALRRTGRVAPDSTD
ncbi:hypothetical protein [Kitasatospora sp. NPDC088346]|uniref:hypothetical protein n=1 Tax=Kitasatospora sp. NPDC088346 TaxID=3364073 RepID=UPI0037F81816